MDSRARFWSLVTSRLFIAVAVGAIAVVTVAFSRTLLRRAELAREIKALQDEVASYQQKGRELTDLMAYLQSSEFQEKEARLRLNLRKPGEQVVVLPGDTSRPEQAPGPADGTGMTSTAGWRQWWNYFFKP